MTDQLMWHHAKIKTHIHSHPVRCPPIHTCQDNPPGQTLTLSRSNYLSPSHLNCSHHSPPSHACHQVAKCHDYLELSLSSVSNSTPLVSRSQTKIWSITWVFNVIVWVCPQNSRPENMRVGVPNAEAPMIPHDHVTINKADCRRSVTCTPSQI